jgi:hypothetical protein
MNDILTLVISDIEELETLLALLLKLCDDYLSFPLYLNDLMPNDVVYHDLLID